MTNRQFFDLVEEMRNAQKKYFRTRDKFVLAKSKDLEHKVDAEINRVNQILHQRGVK